MTTFRFYRDQSTPRRWDLKSSTRSRYMLYKTLGHGKPTYRDGISRGEPTRTHVTCFNAWKFQKISTKEEHLLKILSGKKPTVPVLEGSKREEGPPLHPSLRRAALASARGMMQDIQSIIRQVKKRHACCISPGTLPKSAK